jgi:hypothetical protein
VNFAIESDLPGPSGPMTITTTPNDAAQSGRGHEQPTDIPTTLWIRAFNKLSTIEHETLTPFFPDPGCSDSMSILDSIQIETQHAVVAKGDTAWTIKWRGEDIVLRDIAMKILL